MADSAPKPKRARGRPPKAKEPDIEAAATAGAEAALAAKGAPPPGDEPPGPGSGQARRSRRKRVSKQVTQQIEDALTEILQLPAVPCAMVGDEWAAEHFTNAGREFAHQVAVVSERHPVLRRWCERALEGESVAILAFAAIAYAAPPLIHWNIIPGPAGLLGVPRQPSRRERPAPSPTQGTEWHEPTPSPPEPTPPAEPVSAIEFEGEDGGVPTFAGVS